MVAGAKDTAGKNAVGPSRYPERITQFAGRLAGVPVLPNDDALVNVAVPSLVPLRFVPAKVARARLASLRSVEDKFALAKLALERFAPLRSVDDKFVPAKLALERFTPEKFNVLKSAPVKLAVGPIK